MPRLLKESRGIRDSTGRVYRWAPSRCGNPWYPVAATVDCRAALLFTRSGC